MRTARSGDRPQTQIRRIFPKFGGIRRIWAGPNLKIAEFTVHCFKISEKDKNQQKKYVKKLDRILRLLVKKFL
jgi:hypothetical protein